MRKLPLKRSVKKNNAILLFLVLLVLFFFEIGSASQYWHRDLVAVDLISQKNAILITIGIYDYTTRPKTGPSHLDFCYFEASEDNEKYFKLMDIETAKQKRNLYTKAIFRNKKENATIVILNTYLATEAGILWVDNLKDRLDLMINNSGRFCSISLKWCLGLEFWKVRYIRISGLWSIEGQMPDYFENIVYKLNESGKNALNTNNPSTIKQKSKNKTVKILKDSDAIVIKGADLDSNIKVYSASGLEIRSIILDNDVVKIKLPTKKIYVVHIGNSRYKVAL